MGKKGSGSEKYTMVLAEKLRKEVERKGIVPENQTRFIRGMGTIDNIYVLNYVINRQLDRKEGEDGGHVCGSESNF